MRNGLNGSAGQISNLENPKPGRSRLARLLLYVGCIAGAAGLFVAYEHFNMTGPSSLSIAALVAAALLALVPVRALVGEIFAVERKALHLLHGVGGLALIALPLSGLVSGGPMLNHAAMAPFAMMGAAQAMMHQPRRAEHSLARLGTPQRSAAASISRAFSQSRCTVRSVMSSVSAISCSL